MDELDDLSVAIIVDPDQPLGLLANTVATIAIGIGASTTALAGARLEDNLGRSVFNSANRPVPVLQAPSDVLQSLLMKAIAGQEDATVVPFPRFARSIHGFGDYQKEFGSRDLNNEAIDGLGLAGPRRWVKSLTGNLKLLR